MTQPITLGLLASVAPSEFQAELLIPIVAIVGGLSIPIFAFYFQHRKRQLQASIIEKAIEQGLSTEEIRELLEQHGIDEPATPKCEKKSMPFRSGLVLLAIGAAFFLAENPQFIDSSLPSSNFMRGSGSFVSYLLMGLGCAYLLSDVLNFSRYKDKE